MDRDMEGGKVFELLEGCLNRWRGIRIVGISALIARQSSSRIQLVERKRGRVEAAVGRREEMR